MPIETADRIAQAAYLYHHVGAPGQIGDVPLPHLEDLISSARIWPYAHRMMVAKKFSPPRMDNRPKVRNASKKSNWPEDLITLRGG